MAPQRRDGGSPRARVELVSVVPGRPPQHSLQRASVRTAFAGGGETRLGTDAVREQLSTLQDQPVASGFDDIIVDEAQDLRSVDLRVIQQFVAPSPAKSEGAVHSVMILADAAQTLYSRGFSWKQAGIQARGHTVILRKNYRNTRQVAEAAAHLHLRPRP